MKIQLSQKEIEESLQRIVKRVAQQNAPGRSVKVESLKISGSYEEGTLTLDAEVSAVAEGEAR